MEVQDGSFTLVAETPSKPKYSEDTKSYMVEWRKERKKKACTWTYFITDGTAIKIGLALDLPERLSTLQQGNHRTLKFLGIVELDRERELHIRFAKYHMRGEWFALCDEIVDWIKEHGFVRYDAIDQAKSTRPNAAEALN